MHAALPPADPCSPEALALLVERFAVQEYALATPAERIRIDAERAAAAEEYARDLEGCLVRDVAALRAALATHAAAHSAAGDPRP